MTKWNGKRFSIYTSDEENVLNMVEELGKQTNHNTDTLEDKTDLHGDHKGTWQGLNRPTMSEEGLRATVEDIIGNKIPSIQTTMDNYVEKIEMSLDNYAKKDDVAKISNGTPLFANSVSEMTDNTKNYVNNKDGYLYIYNDGSWAKTNVLYQSSGIADKSINHKKLEEGLQSLFIPYYSDEITPTWIEGYAMDYNGSVTANSSYKYAKYPVKGNEVYKIKTKRLWLNCGWLIMDSSNNVLLTNTNVNNNDTIEEIIQIPPTGAYLCFNNSSNSFSYLVKEKYKLKEEELNIKFSDLPQELRDSFEKVSADVTSELQWITGKYVKSNGTFSVSADHSYAEISVSEELECEITGSHSWEIACYVVKDKDGTVILEDGASNSTVTKFNNHIFTIPKGGAKLYINKYNFEELKFNNKLSAITNVKSVLENKTLLFTGDSICSAIIEDGVNNKHYGWCEIIKENNPSAIVKNYGIGGTTIAKINGKNNSILERLDTMYSNYPVADYIIIEGGVNDCYSKVIELGDISDGYDTSFNEYTFCGALESLFKNAILKWKGKKIGYIVTFKVPTADYNNFKLYMDKAKQICEKWSIPYIDLYNNSGLQYHIPEIAAAYSYNGGGLHPNIEGYRIITPKIESWIKTL